MFAVFGKEYECRVDTCTRISYQDVLISTTRWTPTAPSQDADGFSLVLQARYEYSYKHSGVLYTKSARTCLYYFAWCACWYTQNPILPGAVPTPAPAVNLMLWPLQAPGLPRRMWTIVFWYLHGRVRVPPKHATAFQQQYAAGYCGQLLSGHARGLLAPNTLQCVPGAQCPTADDRHGSSSTITAPTVTRRPAISITTPCYRYNDRIALSSMQILQTLQTDQTDTAHV